MKRKKSSNEKMINNKKFENSNINLIDYCKSIEKNPKNISQDFIWTKVNFTEDFYSSINDTVDEKNNSNDHIDIKTLEERKELKEEKKRRLEQKILIKEKIDDILNGNFENLNINIVSYKDFLYGTFGYTFPSNETNNDIKLKLLFMIYFKKIVNNNKDKIDPTKIYFEENLTFINISYSAEILKNSLLTFRKENYLQNSNLEYDKTGKLKNSNIFFNKIITSNNKKIYYPFNQLISQASQRKIIVIQGGKINESGYDFSKLDLAKMQSDVYYELEKKDNFNFDEFFKNAKFTTTPNETEKNLIDTCKNIILSGRPGTGKTYIILFKSVLLFLNNLYEEKKLSGYDGSLEQLYNNIKYRKTPGEIYKLVFISLSQQLCSKVEEMFYDHLSKLNIHFEKNTIHDIMELTSFRENFKYPLFINFRKIIFMIDGSLNYQFFDREVDNKMQKKEDECDLLFFPNCNYDCNYPMKTSEYIDEKSYFFRTDFTSNTQKYILKEINVDDFILQFSSDIDKNPIFNDKKKGIKINAYEVYSQIISVIKGSLLSYCSLSNGLIREEYLNTGHKLSLFDLNQKNEIYEYFIKYEKWKQENNYFDFQDVVNYLIRQVIIELVPKKRKLIDILFIDEVQDFSINQLYLMILISRNIKILAGDTCQTISKVNRFRFCDLNGIFYTLEEINEIEKPIEKQIMINFRCNSKILKLAFVIFQFIFKFFGNTLDKVKLDFSTKISENLPVIINLNDNNYITSLLTSNNDNQINDNLLNNFDIKSKLVFGFKHCFICKTEEIANNLNKQNNKIVASTINLCKGLEYEIVIIYNFFKDTPQFIKSIWKKILTKVKLEIGENTFIPDIKNELEILKNNISKEKQKKILSEFNTITIPNFSFVIDEEISHLFFNLCSELKELYVAITRARSFLFFYDEDLDIFPLFKKILIDNKLVDTNANDMLIKVKKFLDENPLSKEEMENLAQEEFKSERYFDAIQHFKILNNQNMIIKCNIFILLKEIKDMKNKLKDNKDEKIQQEFLEKNNNLLDLCHKNKFDEKEIIGELLVNLKRYDEAKIYFLEKGNIKKCGLICKEEKNYLDAFKYFSQINEYSSAIECLGLLEKYEKLFDYINDINDKIDLKHFIRFYNTYANKYLKTFKLVHDKTIGIDTLFQEITNTKNVNNNINNINNINKNDDDQENINECPPLIYANFHEYKIKSRKYFNKFNFDNINSNINNFTLIKNKSYFNYTLPIYGINQFQDFHFIKNESLQRFQIKYDKTDTTFFSKIDDNKDFTKSKDDKSQIIKRYKSLVNFIYNYNNICSFKSNSDINDISPNLFKFKAYIEKLNNPRNTNSIDEKISDIQIINLIKNTLNEFGDKESIRALFNVHVFKNDIIKFLLNKLPLLYYHKLSGYEFTKENQSQIQNNLNKTLVSLVSFSKNIGLGIDDMKKCLKAVLVLNGHFTSVLPLLKYDTLLLYSGVLSKRKLFFKSLILNNVNFLSNQYSNYFLYSFATYLRININHFFKLINTYLIKNGRKESHIYFHEMKDVLRNLMPYTKIYVILYDIFVNIFYDFKDQKELKEFANFPRPKCDFYLEDYIKEFMNFLEKNNNAYKNEEFMELIEIGTTISLIVMIFGIKSGFMDWNITNQQFKSTGLSYRNCKLTIALYELLEKIRNVSISDNQYIKKLILFTLFSSFSINIFPNISEFQMYLLFPICIINKSSIIFWENEYNIYSINQDEDDEEFDNKKIISDIITNSNNNNSNNNNNNNKNDKNDKKNKNKNKNKKSILITSFDSHEKNYIISYASAYNILFTYMNNFIKQLYTTATKENDFKFIIDPISLYNLSNDKLQGKERRTKYIQKFTAEGINNFLFLFVYKSFNNLSLNATEDKMQIEEIFYRSLIYRPTKGYSNEEDYINYLYPFLINDYTKINFSAITIILGMFPLKAEKIDIPDIHKQIKLFGNLFNKLFNGIYVLYDKYSMLLEKDKNIGEKEIRIYTYNLVNYFLFVNLLEKYIKLNYNSIHNKPNFLQFKEEEEYFFDENKIEDYYNKFSYVEALEILSNKNYRISGLLKVIWIRKIYLCFYCFLQANYPLKNYIYISINNLEINKEEMDKNIYIKLRDSSFNVIPGQEDKLFNLNHAYLFLQILFNFVKEYFSYDVDEPNDINKNNNNNIDSEKTDTKKKKRFEVDKENTLKWLEIYFEMEIYLIYCSLTKIKGLKNDLENDINKFKKFYEARSYYYNFYKHKLSDKKFLFFYIKKDSVRNERIVLKLYHTNYFTQKKKVKNINEDEDEDYEQYIERKIQERNRITSSIFLDSISVEDIKKNIGADRNLKKEDKLKIYSFLCEKIKKNDAKNYPSNAEFIYSKFSFE